MLSCDAVGHFFLKEFFPVILTVSFATTSFAANTQNMPEGKVVVLSSPAECIAVALANNLDLNVRFFEDDRLGALLEAEQGGFDPFAEFSADFIQQTINLPERSQQEKSSVTSIRPSLSPSWSDDRDATSLTYRARIIQPLPTGGELALNANADRTRQTSQVETDRAEVGFSFEQPLLRDFAFDAARIPLKRAHIDAAIGQLEVRRAILDVAKEVEVAFWEFFAADRGLKIARAALVTSQTLVEEATARRETGLADRIEIIEAESARASREEAVIEAERTREDQRDRLLALLGCLGVRNEPHFSLLTPPPPVAPPVESEDETMARIRRELPDYVIALREADRARLALDAAKSDSLPKLDLRFSASIRGDGMNVTRSWRAVRQSREQELAAGVVFGLPLTTREERARIRAAIFEVGGREIALARVEQDLRLRLRLARRAVAAAPARIQATKSSRLLAEERFQQTRALYNEGLAPLRDVLPAQDTMERERLRELRARLDAAIAAVDLARLDATLLWRNRIDWERTQR